MSKNMSEEIVSFDSALNKLRILPADRADTSSKIKEECLDFSTELGILNEKTVEIVNILQKRSNVLEQQKMTAIGMRNAVAKEKQGRDPLMAQLQNSIRDKQIQLDKLTMQQQSLDKVLQQQHDLIELLGSR